MRRRSVRLESEEGEGGGGNTRQRRGRKAVYRAVIYLRPRLNGCRRYELPGSRGPMDLCASSPLLLRYIEWVREPVRLRDRAPPVKDTGKIYRNPMRRKRADICVSRAARKRSKNRPVDTKNKGSSRLRVVVSRPGPSLALPARTSRGAINRRKQSLIFRNFNSQSVNRARGSLRDEQNVHSVLRENPWIQAARDRPTCIYLRGQGYLAEAGLDTCVVNTLEDSNE